MGVSLNLRVIDRRYGALHSDHIHKNLVEGPIAMAWAKIPTSWIRSKSKLLDFTWRKNKSDATAALIILMALAIRLNQKNQSGKQHKFVSVSYDDLQLFTGLSRIKVSAALRLLEAAGILTIRRHKRTNRYMMNDILKAGCWAQLPQTHLVQNGTLVFAKFQLRHRNELNALKLYLLLVAYRNAHGNFTAIGYDRICEISGLLRNDVMSACALLINFELITVEEHDTIAHTAGRPHKRYRICGLDKLSR